MKISIQDKKLKDLNIFTQINQCLDSNGKKYFAKIIKNSEATKYGIEQTLAFNREVLIDTNSYIFPQHFLAIVSQLITQQVTGYITEPYQCNLQEYIQKNSIKQPQALQIFQHVLKSIYSLYKMSYNHKNIRPEHFVKVGKLWKLQSLVFCQDYDKANNVKSQYIWNQQYQAPQFYKEDSAFTDEEFKLMFVWNLGSLLLDLLLTTHKLSNITVIDKFKGQSFSFQKIGIPSAVSDKFSVNVQTFLGQMLHHNPAKRMKLEELFCQQFFSKEISSKHKKETQLNASSSNKNQSNQESLDKNIIVDNKTKQIFDDFNTKVQKQSNILKLALLNSSKIDEICKDDQFTDFLLEFSYKIQPKPKPNQVVNSPGHCNLHEIEQGMIEKSSRIKKAFQMYKCYHDQSELLGIAVSKIDEIQFAYKTSSQSTTIYSARLIFYSQNQKEVKLLNKFAIIFVSLIHLNNLTQNINKNINFLNLDADTFESFLNLPEYGSFKEILNHKRQERGQYLENLRKELGTLRDRRVTAKYPEIRAFLEKNYRKCDFAQIKTPYRLILKMSYDCVAEKYYSNKSNEFGQKIARLAMYVMFCMTVDKLYIRDKIIDNFKPYFIWANKTASQYISVYEFKKYIENAPKGTLVDHCRSILKEYYNINQ